MSLKTIEKPQNFHSKTILTKQDVYVRGQPIIVIIFFLGNGHDSKTPILYDAQNEFSCLILKSKILTSAPVKNIGNQ